MSHCYRSAAGPGEEEVRKVVGMQERVGVRGHE